MVLFEILEAAQNLFSGLVDVTGPIANLCPFGVTPPNSNPIPPQMICGAPSNLSVHTLVRKKLTRTYPWCGSLLVAPHTTSLPEL